MSSESQTRLSMHLALAVGGVLAALAVVAVYLAAGGYLARGDRYEVRAVLPTSSSLVTGARVTMAGAQVGRVDDVERQGYATVVRMSLDDDRVYPIPADTRVTLRQRTPVGENYIALTPGRSEHVLPEGSVLRIGRSDEYVDVDQLLSTLQGRTHDDTRRLIRSAGGALDGHGEDLNVVLGRSSDLVESAGSIFTMLERNKTQTARVVDRLGRLTAQVGERDAAIREIAERGNTALEAVADRDDRLHDLLEVLPSTLAQVRTTSGTLRSTSVAALPVVDDLTHVVAKLEPVLRNLRPAASTGRRVLAELGRAAPALRTTLGEAEKLSGPLTAAFPGLRTTLCEANPALRYVNKYRRDLVSPLIGLGSGSNSYDAIGHLLRLQPILGENSIGGLPDELSQALHTLTRAGIVSKITALDWNPYPEPNRNGLDAADPNGNNLTGPASMAKSGYVFPRIEADC